MTDVAKSPVPMLEIEDALPSHIVCRRAGPAAAICGAPTFGLPANSVDCDECIAMALDPPMGMVCPSNNRVCDCWEDLAAWAKRLN